MGILVALATVVFAIFVYISYQYLSSRRKAPVKSTTSVDITPCRSNLKISYSLPDIQEALKKEVYWQGGKKVDLFISSPSY